MESDEEKEALYSGLEGESDPSDLYINAIHEKKDKYQPKVYSFQGWSSSAFNRMAFQALE